MLKTYLWFFVLTGFFSVSVSAVCRGEAVPEVVWQCLESRHTLIRYQSERDLRKFNGRIQFRAERFIFSRLFSPLGAKDLAATVTTKVDALFERAQQILDMRRKIKKYKIRYNVAVQTTADLARQSNIFQAETLLVSRDNGDW